MSRKSKSKEGFEGFQRCDVCDYCELSHSEFEPTEIILHEGTYKRGRSFFYDKKEDKYICSVCHESDNESRQFYSMLDDAKHDEEIDMFIKKLEAIRNNQIQPDWSQPKNSNPTGSRQNVPKVTLPKISGVNEGPIVDPSTLKIKKNG